VVQLSFDLEKHVTVPVVQRNSVNVQVLAFIALRTGDAQDLVLDSAQPIAWDAFKNGGVLVELAHLLDPVHHHQADEVVDGLQIQLRSPGLGVIDGPALHKLGFWRLRCSLNLAGSLILLNFTAANCYICFL